MSQNITKDTTIADILEINPDSVQVMLDAGLQCVGCSANLHETLEQGMIGHGFSTEEIDEMVIKINNANEGKNKDSVLEPQAEDYLVMEITEGNKKYHKLAGLLFTQRAYDALHEHATCEGLQIAVEAGGCSGYSYKYEYTEDPANEDQIYVLSENLHIYMSDFTYSKLHGSVVDFQSGLSGSGLTFKNPNVESECSCGVSVGF